MPDPNLLPIIDPKLKNVSFYVSDLLLCQILLMNDARFPWLILVPKRASTVEIFELDPQDQRLLWEEVSHTASKMKTLFAADKMNIASLGNQVPQLHIHIIARKTQDSLWPLSVFGRGEAVPYDEVQASELIEKLKRMF